MGFVLIPVQYTQCISQLAVYVPLRYMQLYDEYYRTSVAICSTKIIVSSVHNMGRVLRKSFNYLNKSFASGAHNDEDSPSTSLLHYVLLSALTVNIRIYQ